MPGILSLTIQNLLSFGEVPTRIELRPLNVLIGPNGSGTSNLIEILGLLQNTPKDLATAIGNGGSIDEWLWKGAAATPIASIRMSTIPPDQVGRYKPEPLRYSLAFTKSGFRFQINQELVDNEGPIPDQRGLQLGLLPHDFYYANVNGNATFNQRGQKIPLRFEDINPQSSILAQRKDPEHYPEITYLGDLFSKFRLYRDWEFGTLAQVREPCDASLSNDYLEDDVSNLGVVLDRLLARPAVKRQILDSLRTLYGSATDLRISVEGGRYRHDLKRVISTPPSHLRECQTGRSVGLLCLLFSSTPNRHRWSASRSRNSVCIPT